MKRPVRISGRQTSVSVETEFWDGLREIARSQHRTIGSLISEIAAEADRENLSAAIRIAVFRHFRNRAAQAAPR